MSGRLINNNINSTKNHLSITSLSFLLKKMSANVMFTTINTNTTTTNTTTTNTTTTNTTTTNTTTTATNNTITITSNMNVDDINNELKEIFEFYEEQQNIAQFTTITCDGISISDKKPLTYRTCLPGHVHGLNREDGLGRIFGSGNAYDDHMKEARYQEFISNPWLIESTVKLMLKRQEADYYDYLENPDDHEDEDYDEGCSRCFGCNKLCFLVNGRCKSCTQLKIFLCDCCQVQLPESLFPFTLSEEQVEEGEYRPRSNTCCECQIHNDKSYCYFSEYCDYDDSDTEWDTNLDRNDDYCIDCGRPDNCCLCDCSNNQHCHDNYDSYSEDEFCDVCGSRYCHCHN